MIKCTHWKDCGLNGAGCCSINEYKKPSFGVCLKVCKKNTHKPSKGLGDTVEKVIKALTKGKVKPCGGCKKRKEALNKMMPYKDN
tara:strand:- start:50 stop:304 length:255 start_codon:yes stop_codon:yes gene_type:complete